MKAIVLAALIFLLFAQPALALDHQELERGLPTELDDAYPTPYRAMELNLPARWFRTLSGGKHEDEVLLAPRFQYGVLPDTELSIEVPVVMGNADREGSGDIAASLLYNFNTDGIYIPALSLEGGVRAPSGYKSEETETELTALATKALFPSNLYHFIHANVTWAHLFENGSQDREDRLKVVGGYSQRLRNDLLLVADYVYEEQRERHSAKRYLEGGVRFQLLPRIVLSIGAGGGLNSDSPDLIVRGGAQYTF